jgi:hypothetical protein
VILVTGYSGGSLAELFAGNPRVRIVHNENWEKGMFSSVREGMRSVETADFFLALGDMPLVTPEVYRLLRTFQLPGSVIPQCGGKKGLRCASTPRSSPLPCSGRGRLPAYRDRPLPSLVVPVDNTWRAQRHRYARTIQGGERLLALLSRARALLSRVPVLLSRKAAVSVPGRIFAALPRAV